MEKKGGIDLLFQILRAGLVIIAILLIILLIKN